MTWPLNQRPEPTRKATSRRCRRGCPAAPAAKLRAGACEPNDRYGPVRDDFTKLTEPDHWLGWLGEDPAATLRKSIAGELSDQVAGAVLTWIKVLETPRFLTAGRPDPDSPEQLVVT